MGLSEDHFELGPVRFWEGSGKSRVFVQNFRFRSSKRTREGFRTDLALLLRKSAKYSFETEHAKDCMFGVRGKFLQIEVYVHRWRLWKAVGDSEKARVSNRTQLEVGEG